MRLSFLILIALFLPASLCFAQQNSSTYYTGEFGFSAGGSEYFGDLNTNSSFRAVKPAIGIFYRKFFNDYIGVRAHFHFAQVGFSDQYSANEFQRRRNLSFDSNIWELALLGDFNFFRFEPGSDRYRFTPYLTFGIGGFAFNPYAWYQDQKYYLQPLGTEGQGSPQYPGRKPYNLQALCFPIGMGIKYNVNKKINIGLEAVHRFTTTDYLDDVSTTYAGPAAFPPGANGKQSIAAILQDRSGITGTPIGVAGAQRGNSQNKDQYIFIELNISFLFTSYRCPAF